MQTYGIYVTYKWDGKIECDFIEEHRIKDWSKKWLDSYFCFDSNHKRHGEILEVKDGYKYEDDDI